MHAAQPPFLLDQRGFAPLYALIPRLLREALPGTLGGRDAAIWAVSGPFLIWDHGLSGSFCRRKFVEPNEQKVTTMAQQSIALKATVRPRAGKGAARQARREGKVPGVIYGDNQTPQTINVEYPDLWKAYIKGHFTSTVVDLDVDGTHNRVIPRDVQVDPIKDLPLHVDFLRVGKDGRIRVAVAVKFVNEALSPGLKKGGVLNIVRHDIEVYCPYDQIPMYFEVDLTGLEIGRSVHISAVTMPDGVKPVIHNRDFTIATVAGAVKKDEEAPAAAAAAPAGGAAAPAAGGKAAAPAAGGKAAAPAAGAKAAAAPAAKKK
jgi:large subunit ribosomal protein L25